MKLFQHQKLTLLSIIPLLLGLLGLSHSARAVVSCSPSTIYPAKNMTVTVNVSSYAGNEIPVGSTIYHAQSQAGSYSGVKCNAPFTLASYYSVTNTPSGPAVPFSSLSYSAGPIFPTNVSGVGVVLWYAGTPFSDVSPYLYYTATMPNVTGGDFGFSGKFEISLVKTGPIASGSIVNASSFPTVVLMIPATSGYTGLPLNLMTINFAGSVNFVASTCTTPDLNVNMGPYEISDNFKQVGSATPWVDASITLQNCPTFSGRYGDGSTSQVSVGTATASGTTRIASTLTVTLTPNTPMIDAPNGVIGVNAQRSSGTAATGIGLQLGYTPTNYAANPTAPTSIWTSGTSWDIQPPSDGSNSFKIPLAARYYQTDARVTAGPANTAVTFNIDYK